MPDLGLKYKFWQKTYTPNTLTLTMHEPSSVYLRTPLDCKQIEAPINTFGPKALHRKFGNADQKAELFLALLHPGWLLSCVRLKLVLGDLHDL